MIWEMSVKRGNAMARKVALTGATGNIGSIVVPALIMAGAEVTSLVRDSAKAKALEEQGAKTVQGGILRC